jgi:YVTN family beta-propeller protein
MRRQILTAALSFSMLLMPSCSQQSVQGGTSSGGSVGITSNDALVYAADSDLDTVFVFDTKTNTKVGEIKVGKQPEKVLVSPDNTVFVTNRMDRSVSVIRSGDMSEAARIKVGIEPVGLAMSADGKILYVVNATSISDVEVGTLQAIDTQTLLPLFEIPVGNEPRSVALVEGNKALVSLYKSGDVVLVDLAAKRVIKNGSDVFNRLNGNTLGIANPDAKDQSNRFGGSDAFPSFQKPSVSRPRGIEAMTTSMDGKQVYATTRLSSEKTLVNQGSGPSQVPGGGSSSGYGGNTSCGGSGAVAQPALLTFGSDGNAQVDDLALCNFGGADRPTTILASNLPGVPLQGPKAMAVNDTGDFLFVAHFESNNVAIVPTFVAGNQRNPGNNVGTPPPSGFNERGGGFASAGNQTVNVGAGPTGVALAHDGKRAFVLNSFDHSLSVLETKSGRVVQTQVVKLGNDVLTPDAVEGRKLFFSAVDPRMNDVSFNGIGCGSCHFEGREDGHVWNFVDGPRQTPSLAGRMLSKTAPFHWNGEFGNLMDFMQMTVTKRMGGSGVSTGMEKQMAAFIDSMPAVDNPHVGSTPADVVARGKAAFNKANCQTCHVGEALTNNEFANVGTFVTTGTGVKDDAAIMAKGLNNPSLLGVSRTAPFLHDGSQSTLKGRILSGKSLDQHGKTSVLSEAEVDDLVSYLKTL